MNFRVCFVRSIAVAAFAFVGMMSLATAQTADVDEPLIQHGDAVVTGFSGIVALKPKPNAKLEDYLIIDTQAPALQFFDLSQMFGGDNARLVDAPRLHAVSAGQIGQVFGVALDDGRPADGVDDGRDPVPNIYATATSAYGLQLVETKQVGNEKVRERAKMGSPDVSWMDGQFGVGGGPGSIWRIDGRTGEATLFADVTLDDVANSAPALGAITFDPGSRRLYVSDLQTGMIHAFDLNGEEVDRYDHGTQGRPAEDLTEVAYDPQSRVEITSPDFNVEDPKTWGFAPRERKVWGLAVFGRRLFYAVDDGPTIWSVGLLPSGDFAKDVRAEIDVQTESGDAISGIAFSRGGTIYLSQRGAAVPTYDYQVMATPQTAQTLRYKRKTLPNGDIAWRVLPEEYAIGQSGEHRSSNGGVALGYGYDANGFIRRDVCEGTVWSTGEVLRQTAKPDPVLAAGGETVVQGLQGTPIGAVMPNNAPPMQSFYIDYDAQFLDPGFRGHMGQVAIWGCDGRPRVSTAPRPHGPHIKIAKKCSAAGFGNRMHCRVTLYNAGDEAPLWPVGFSDEADILHGPANASRIRIVSATPSHPGWQCSAVPTSEFGCEIDGELLRPGRRRFVDVVMDVSSIASTPGFRVRNCAFLDDDSDFACTSGGENLIVEKTGDRLCEAGQFCTFDLSVTNAGRRTFDGRLFLADNISLPGVPALDVAFISPPIPGCDPATLPFQCNVPMILGPGRSRTFEVTVAIPRNAVRPGRTVQGRNCFFASDPGLIPDRGRRRVSFLKATLRTLNRNSPSAGPGFECFNFTVQAPGAGPIAPRCEIPIASLRLTPTPASFKAANQKIKVEIEFDNTGNNKFVAIEDWKVAAPQLNNLTCALQTRGLDPRTFALCKGEYTTKASDFGKPIVLTATATGDSACGKIAAVKASGTVAFTGQPVLVLAATPTPATYKAANEKITYTYTVKNTGPSPIPLFSLNGGKATDVKCAAGGPVLSFSACASSNSTCAPLAAGASLTCTGTYTTKVSDLGKDITTVARAEGGLTVGAIGQLNPKPDLVATPVKLLVKYAGPPVAPPPGKLGKPAMTLAVTPAPATFSTSNQKITYNYTLKNTGAVPITFFGFNDTVATDVRCPGVAVPAICPSNVNGSGSCGALAVGASVSCSGSYTTKPGDIGKDLASKVRFAGKIDADPNGIDVSGEADTVVEFTASPNAKPKLEITKYTPKSATFAAANEKISYRYIVSNIGDAALTSFTLTDSKVTGLKCQPKSAGPQGGAMAPGQGLICTGTYTTTAADVGKDVTSTANVTGVSAKGAVPPPPPANAVVKFNTNPGAPGTPGTPGIAGTPGTPGNPGGAGTPTGPNLSLAMATSPATFSAANQKIAVTYTIKSTGALPVRSFSLADKMTKDIKCQPANTGAKGGPLTPGASATCTGSYTTTSADVGKTITLTAVVNGEATSPTVFLMRFAKAAHTEVKFDPSAVPPVAGKPELKLWVRAEPDDYRAANTTITYTYTLDNIGSVPVTGFAITDNKVTGIKCAPANSGAKGGPLAPGASAVCTGTYTTKAIDIPKSILTVASVTGTTATGKLPPQKPTNKRVNFIGAPNLIAHSYQPRPATFSNANEKIEFSYIIFNYGELPVTSFTITDTKVKNIKCPPKNAGPSGGPLAITNGDVICTGIYTTTAADVGKDIESRMTVTGTSILGPIKSTPRQAQKATVTYKAPAVPPKFKFNQYAADPSFTGANQRVNYQYGISNVGKEPIATFTVTDSKASNITCGPKNTGPTGGPVPANTNTICTGWYLTTAADVGKDLVTEARMVATSASGASAPAVTMKRTVKFDGAGSARLVVYPNPEKFSAANVTIQYSYDVYNTGKVPITAFKVTDNKVTGITCPVAVLAPGKGVRCAGSYVTAAADVGRDITTTTNVTGASANGAFPATPDNKNVIKFVTPADPPKITLIQYASEFATFSGANERMAYQYGISNAGKVPIATFTVTDSRASNITCGPKNTGPTGGPIPVNGRMTCTGSYKTTAADVGKDIVTEARAVGISASGASTPAVTMKRTIEFKKPAKLEILNATAEPPTFSAAGIRVLYRYTIINKGLSDAPAFKIIGSKGAKVECEPNKSPIGGVVKAGNVNFACLGHYTTTAADVGKDIENEIGVIAMLASGPVASTEAKKVVVKFVPPTAPPKPVATAQNFEMMQVKAVPSTFSAAGEKIDYVMIVKGNGLVPATATFMVTGKKISDIKCAPAYTSPVGRGPFTVVSDCKGSYTTTAADVGKDIESRAEVASITAAGMSPPSAAAARTAVVKFAGKAAFDLHHECYPKVYANPGQVIGCEFVIRNTGTVPIQSCRITGSRLNAVCPTGMIPPGGSVLVKGSYTSTLADVGKNIVIDYKIEGLQQ